MVIVRNIRKMIRTALISSWSILIISTFIGSFLSSRNKDRMKFLSGMSVQNMSLYRTSCNPYERPKSENITEEKWCNNMRLKPMYFGDNLSTGVWPEFIFKPEVNNPVFLEASVQRAGLGHSLMSLNGLIHIAVILRLTLRIDMRAAGSGHAVSSDFADSLFQDYFSAALPARCTDLRTVFVKYDTLSTVISHIRNEANTSGLCFVLRMNGKYPRTEGGFNPCGYRAALRARLPRPTNLRCIGANQSIKIALHLRRGDVVSGRHRAAQLKLVSTRGVPNKCAADLLLQVLEHLRASTDAPVDVVVHAEGSRSIRAVIDVDRSYSDFSASAVGESRSLGPEDAAQAMADICGSHVLVAGKSGFSHVLALFCASTVVVAVPFWSSYAYLRNVLVAEEVPNATAIDVSGSALSFASYRVDARALEAILRAFGVL